MKQTKAQDTQPIRSPTTTRQSFVLRISHDLASSVRQFVVKSLDDSQTHVFAELEAAFLYMGVFHLD